MCLSSIYWAGIDRIFYANTRGDAAAIDFDDSFIYDQIPMDPADRTIPPYNCCTREALEAFRLWDEKERQGGILTIPNRTHGGPQRLHSSRDRTRVS